MTANSVAENRVVSQIEINAVQSINRIRSADTSKIESLADSIRQIGLMNPISVRPDYRLIAGMHRLEACKLLEWKTIPAIIQDYSANDSETADLLSELAEIDENLIRNDLTALDQSIHHARRKRIYEKLHPEAKHGGDRKSDAVKNQVDNLSACSYSADAAQATGESERTVRRNTKIGESLEAVAEQLRGTSIEDNQSELMELAKISIAKPELAAVIVEKLVAEKVAEQAKPAVASTPTKSGGAKVKKQPTPKKKKTVTVKSIVSETKKQERIDDINEQAAAIAESEPSAPVGPFHVISIDPPWPYGTQYDPEGRRAANPYPEMSLEQIKAIKLPAADDCVLWLWTTHKFMRHSFDLLDTWGFKDVAIVTWVKDRMGLGSWLRSQSEFCIMAIKGKPPTNLTNQTTILHGPLREHSRKPDSFYDMVDKLCVGAKLDYFSRQSRKGWSQVGNTTGLFNGGAK